MTDTEAVAAALARLANGTAGVASQAEGVASQPHSAPTSTDQSAPPPPAAVVAEARHALARLQTAATFVDDSGQRRLSQAVTEAERAGDQPIVDQGEALLATLERFREAANTGAATPDRQRLDDHFHRGHATLLAGDDIAPER